MSERWNMRRRMAKVWEEQSAQALIECALSATLLAVLLLSAVEFGRMAYAAIEVSNAARAAAQYGSMNGGAFLSSDATGLDSVGMLNAAQLDAGNMGSSVTFTSGYPTYSCYCSLSTDTTASCVAPATPTGCSASHIIVNVTVQTQADFNPLIHVPGFGNTIRLYGKAQQEVLQ